jgi:release factor glutamine methyltransferase
MSQQTIQQQLQWASSVLASITCSARLDSEILLAHCLQKDRSYLMTWPERELQTQQLECFRELVAKRLQPQPIAYLTGVKEFYSLNLKTTPATLVPRPETEMLVDQVLELINGLAAPNILELGTGTGAIALAIKKHAPHSQLMATDISEDALDVARDNARQHHLNVEFVLSDWFQAISPQQRYDVIVSNPPYIPNHDPYLSQGDLPAEPRLALTSGDDGLQALRHIIESAPDYLKPAGWLVLEHGYDQQLAVNQLLAESGFGNIQTLEDFNQLPRLSMGQQAAL